MNLFTDLPLSPLLQGNLTKKGFAKPTPVQSQAIPPALAGHDIVATAQTGTGKTLAFVLPLLESLLRDPKAKGTRAVVLSPTRELAIQIAKVFEDIAPGTGMRASVVVGGMSENTQLQSIRRGAQVIIATPGRLCDFIDRRLVDLSAVKTLILDEGDRMLDMGFLPALQMILGKMPAGRQTLFFSATIEPTAAKLISQHLKNPIRLALGSSTKPTENVDLHLYEIEQDRKIDLLHHMLKNETGTFLVFGRTKHGVEKLAKKLSVGGIKATSIHGDRTQGQRNRALHGFQNGEYRVLVATDVAARGIHVEGIAHVVNYDLPMVPEDFIHRVGRTGRAGSRGVATTFGTRKERGDIRNLERSLSIQLSRQTIGTLEPAPEPAPHVLAAMAKEAAAEAAARQRPAGSPWKAKSQSQPPSWTTGHGHGDSRESAPFGAKNKFKSAFKPKGGFQSGNRGK